MSQTSWQNRERAVQVITQRNAIQERIKRTQKQLNALPDSAEQEALQQSLAADQAALAEMSQAFEEIKAQMRQEQERIRRKSQEPLRRLEEWKQSQLWSNSQFPLFSSGRVPSSDSQTFGLFMAAFVVVAIVLGVLILLK